MSRNYFLIAVLLNLVFTFSIFAQQNVSITNDFKFKEDVVIDVGGQTIHIGSVGEMMKQIIGQFRIVKNNLKKLNENPLGEFSKNLKVAYVNMDFLIPMAIVLDKTVGSNIIKEQKKLLELKKQYDNSISLRIKSINKDNREKEEAFYQKIAKLRSKHEKRISKVKNPKRKQSMLEQLNQKLMDKYQQFSIALGKNRRNSLSDTEPQLKKIIKRQNIFQQKLQTTNREIKQKLKNYIMEVAKSYNISLVYNRSMIVKIQPNKLEDFLEMINMKEQMERAVKEAVRKGTKTKIKPIIKRTESRPKVDINVVSSPVNKISEALYKELNLAKKDSKSLVDLVSKLKHRYDMFKNYSERGGYEDELFVTGSIFMTDLTPFVIEKLFEESIYAKKLRRKIR